MSPTLSISLQLEATKYPGIKEMIEGSGIKKEIDIHPSKHMTLVVMKVPIKDIIKTNNKNKKMDEGMLKKEIQKIYKYLETKTTEYVLKVIKPVIDKRGKIELKFMGLELWPSGHFVAVFDDQIEFQWIVLKMREMMKKLFPTGQIMRENDMIPHITLGKYNKNNKKLFDKLKQLKNKIPSYKLIKKQWIIYPTIRYCN